MQLNKQQEEAIEFINNSKGIVLLNGSAGTGKTSCLLGLQGSVDFTATTHQAADVLTKKSKRKATTVHSRLKLKLNTKGAFKKLVQSSSPPFTEQLVVDEASMIDPDLLKFIEDYSSSGAKIILVGDDKQLPPVGYKISPIFERGYPRYTLTELLRQSKENDNLELYNNIPKVFEYKDGKNYKYLDGTDACLDMLVDADGTDACKYLAWTNERVAFINDRVRKAIYGKGVDEYVEGEHIKFTDQYEHGNALYNNNAVVKINSIEGAEVLGLGCYVLNHNILVLPKSAEPLWNRKIQLIIKEAKASNNWAKYWEYKGTFASIQYNHAYTVHRSQGSTYDNCIVDLQNIRKNPDREERTKMVYTAITRTSNNNYFI